MAKVLSSCSKSEHVGLTQVAKFPMLFGRESTDIGAGQVICGGVFGTVAKLKRIYGTKMLTMKQ